MRSWTFGFFCTLIALILVFVTLFGSWFNITSVGTSGGEREVVTLDMGLRDYTFRSEAPGRVTTLTTSHSELSEDMSFVSVFNTTQIMVIIALIFTMLMLLCAFLGKVFKRGRLLGVIIGIIAIILTLATFAHFAAAFPGAMEESTSSGLGGISGFWGSESTVLSGDPVDFTWGPGWAWYLMIVAFIFTLLGTIAFLRARPEKTRKPVYLRY